MNELVLCCRLNVATTKEECEIAASNLGKTYIGAACLKSHWKRASKAQRAEREGKNE